MKKPANNTLERDAAKSAAPLSLTVIFQGEFVEVPKIKHKKIEPRRA